MATDPICGMYVDESSAELKLTRNNRTFYFCSTSCLEQFAEPAVHLARLRRQLAVGWSASLAILVLTYGWHPAYAALWALALASLVQFYPGLSFYRGTLDAIRSRMGNMDVLIAVGTTAAFGYSAAVLLLPGRLPSALYFDASALIITLILTGNYLEYYTREAARGAIRELGKLRPATAFVLRQGAEREVPIAEVRTGDRFLVRPGGRVPADGVVRSGRSSIDEALLTGESFPAEKAPGNRVIAGSINLDGVLEVEATRVGQDTVLAQIGQLVAEAETNRVPLQRTADRIASRFVPAVLLLALVAALGWNLVGAGFTVALLVFVSVAITACPCAFGIAAPAALVVGIGRGAEEGVLFKGRDSLQSAAEVTTVLTDKTGTLTRGTPVLSDLLPAPGHSADELLAVAAGLEAASDHPLARAVREAARIRGTRPMSPTSVRAEPGRGVRGRLGEVEAAILSGSAAQEAGIDASAIADSARGLEADGKSWSLVLEAGRVLGVLGFSDEVAAAVPEAIRALEGDGVRVIMVTGDGERAAQAVARKAGITEVHANVLPAGKIALLKELQGRGEKVAFVGDGINDAPALSAADVGIAIGSGSEVAKEAGGVVLIRPDFRGVALALRLGRRTVAKVRQNFLWALGYNGVLLPVAAGALVPFLGLEVYGVLPITGALAMGLSSTTVVLNSVSLRYVGLARKR